MKILHIITNVNTGGAISLLRKVTSENIDNGIKHVIISLRKPSRNFEIANIDKIYSLNIDNKLFFFTKLIYLIKIIKKENPYIIQTWMYHSDLIGGIAGKILGIRKIYWSILTYSTKGNKYSTQIIVRINAFLSHFIPEKIVFCASASQDIHKKIGYCKDKFVYIPIGFNKENFPISRNNQMKKKEFYIGCIARWDSDKDHENLFNALKILDMKNINYKCDLIGPMMVNENSELQSLINKTNVDKSKLNLKGFVKDLNKAYLNFDVCILPSETEAFPIVIGESMILGTPVIATDTGDIKKIIDQFGWIVPTKNPKELSEAILQAVINSNDDDSWYEFRIAARDHIVKNYDINDMYDKYNKLWIDDVEVIEDFGREWNYFDQIKPDNYEYKNIFDNYFDIFPWKLISKESVGFDMGSGSGRWAKFVAPRVRHLHCIEPSNAINISMQNLIDHKNCSFYNKSIKNINLSEGSMDFGYVLGVVHHISDYLDAIERCILLLKPNAPILFYFYYSFENKPNWYIKIWGITNRIRLFTSSLPFRLKIVITTIIATLIYLPLAKFSKLLSFLKFDTKNVPLDYYKDMSFYTMRTDSLDRFGTKLEQRFSKVEIKNILESKGLKNITFSDNAPFWCVVGYRVES